MKNIKTLWVLILLWLTLVSCGKDKEDETNTGNKANPVWIVENTVKTESETNNNETDSNETNNTGAITNSVQDTEDNLNTNSWTTMSKKTEVNEWDKIAVHYTWTLEDGTVFDSSLERGETLKFEAWAGQMIPGFDAWVIWMKVWEKKNIKNEAKDAYWEYDESRIEVKPKSELESFVAAWYKLDVGEKIPTQFWDLIIVKSDEENVTIDLNHPLAWKKLIFDVEMIEIN